MENEKPSKKGSSKDSEIDEDQIDEFNQEFNLY